MDDLFLGKLANNNQAEIQRLLIRMPRLGIRNFVPCGRMPYACLFTNHRQGIERQGKGSNAAKTQEPFPSPSHFTILLLPLDSKWLLHAVPLRF